MKILLKNIQQLAQIRENNEIKNVKGASQNILPSLYDAYLAIEDGIIVAYGNMADWEGISDWRNLDIIDCSNKIVLPAWCDSHSHILYAGSREQEFAQRIAGKSYEQIAQAGGGILNSALKMNNIAEEELIEQTLPRLKEICSQGTGAIEIKSGYGLTLANELKMLRAIKKLKELCPLTIKSTFLGAHAVPLAYKTNRRAYIDLIIKEMLPQVAEEQLADFCDVFCEENYFTPQESFEILSAGLEHGLLPKVHANQMSHSGGIALGTMLNAISVDHLEYVSDNDINLLLQSNTMPTLLPGAQFFLGLPQPPARKMIDKGLGIAIASDYNPGSCPSGNMQLMMALACINYKLTPEECINAMTINSAYAMGIAHEAGSICLGKKANVLITRAIPNLAFMPYSFGSNNIETVILNGKIVN